MMRYTYIAAVFRLLIYNGRYRRKFRAFVFFPLLTLHDCLSAFQKYTVRSIEEYLSQKDTFIHCFTFLNYDIKKKYKQIFLTILV